MDPNAKKGQLFSSSAPSSGGGVDGAEAASYQPAKALPGEGAEYDALQFDMAAAGFEPLDWNRPKSDLRFVIRQPTLPDLCRGVRLLPEGGTAGDLGRIMLTITVTRIGDLSPTEEEVGAWLDDLRVAGSDLVSRAGMRVCYPSDEADAAFTASRKYDPSRRCFDFRLPRALLPKKAADSFSDDELAFSMRELTYREIQAAADACDDPDDSYAIRVLKVMWSLSSIGGKPLGVSPDELLFRRRWMARVGHSAWLLMAGTWTRMHELDRGLVDRFLDAACAPA